MKKIYSLCILCLLISVAYANKYDYLLFSNNYKDVRKGIDLGADVNSRLRGSTPLYDASRKNNMDILYLLINRGADVNAISHGETALHKVVQFGNLKFAQVLLKEGADPNIKDSIRGNTPLHYAVSRQDNNMIALLMKYGGDMYIENNNGDTPARYILSRVSVPAVRLGDKNILLTSSAFRVSQGSVGFSIANLTPDFVTITYAALYIDGDLVSESQFNRTLPPNASANIGSLPISKDAYKSISISRSGMAKIKYGFAVEYTINGSNKSMYKTTRIDVQVW
ncbi:ankyrin repeat domain-containing protein [Helicobacter cappadocius]|uniref:Ankyrin repeat domain-containing protein n=1 Tax=Helicobacter cappadocius TaxID=3063998 RepID=A0AA90Q1G1_9HELI|nr:MULTISPECIES: ankyrin repeat domain-containing protein [unclassified Helicobacter]MDO7252541.1 ankyrin repeat domain-containing protein [Helicobacter sp. faydin-H75]MDP2538408.1 ankyrin repeat domain-containing protein [Helicobacter sp. faydin-H76]